MAFGAFDPDQDELVAAGALHWMNINHVSIAASRRTIRHFKRFCGTGELCHMSALCSSGLASLDVTRNLNLKSTTVTLGFLKRDPSAVSLHGPLRDRQTQACATAVAGPCLIDPIEPVEHFAAMFLRDPWTAVGDPDPHIAPILCS
jgi:hypothetical protein